MMGMEGRAPSRPPQEAAPTERGPPWLLTLFQYSNIPLFLSMKEIVTYLLVGVVRRPFAPPPVHVFLFPRFGRRVPCSR